MGDLSTTLYVYMHEEGLSQLKRGWLPLTRHFPWLTPYTMGTPRAPASTDQCIGAGKSVAS